MARRSSRVWRPPRVPSSASCAGRISASSSCASPAPEARAVGAPKVTWVYDVISPFAYLMLPRLAQLPAGVELTTLPVLFAGLLEHFGQRGPAEILSKRRFTYRFALWRARRLGLPMRFPPAHPFNPLGALRLAIAAGSTLKAAQVLLDAVFRDGRDVSA